MARGTDHPDQHQEGHTMTARTSQALAAHVALRPLHDYQPAACIAWMEAAERVCAKATTDYLCSRHRAVAEKRYAAYEAKQVARRAKAAAAHAAKLPAMRQRLAKIESRLNAIDPFRTDTNRDSAVQNLPLSKRLPSDARIHELAQLHQARTSLIASIGSDA